MGSKVEVREGETVQAALRRLRQHVKGSEQFSRSWYKSRVGYYEKPSVKNRRKQRIAWINQRSNPGTRPLKMKMGLTWLCRRKRPWP
jgi:ribosomal protein S21